jgi:hypothetical protein
VLCALRNEGFLSDRAGDAVLTVMLLRLSPGQKVDSRPDSLLTRWLLIPARITLLVRRQSGANY